MEAKQNEHERSETILKVTGLKFPTPDPEVEEKLRRRRFMAASDHGSMIRIMWG